MSEIQLLTERVRALNQSTDWWNDKMVWALVLAAVAAIFVVLTTVMALKRAGQMNEAQSELIKAKDRELAVDLGDKGLKIAEAQRGAAEANERATKAQQSLAAAEQHAKEADAKAEGFRADIAKANEGAALAQAQVAGATAEAAKANLELARIKLPRSLNQEQQRRIADALTRFTGTNFAFLVFGDPESLALLSDIDSALQQARWNRVASPPSFGSDIGFKTARGMVSQINDVGLKVYFPADVPAMELIVRSLAAAISSEGVPCEPHFSDRMRGYAPRMILISVGQKRL